MSIYDKRVTQLLREMEEQNIREKEAGLPPEKRARSIPPETGQFLNMLVRIMRPTSILEIGTSRGYSTIWIGVAAKDVGARVVTLEIDPGKAEEATENIRKAGLEEVVSIVQGDALEYLRTAKAEWGFVFIDAEKRDYVKIFELIYPVTVSGGLIVADNVISHREELKEYIHMVENHERLLSLLVPIGKGEMLSYKL